jgi:ABC-type multidrug transport system fused ATPase/permease subunit
VVGERGVTLSGGQRQRAALARTFYRAFDLLLLDDVMSAVDHATEKHLIDAVYRRTNGNTALLVSHRISALSKANRILVLQDGAIVDEGTHQQLCRRPGIYQKTWRLQNAIESKAGEHVHG